MHFFAEKMRLLYPGHTGAATVLRLHCDQFLDEVALDRSKVALWSQYSCSVVVVSRKSRRIVAVAILVALRNFGMFKIPHCDFSIAMQSVCCRSVLAQLVLWSYSGRITISKRSHAACDRIAPVYCDCTSTIDIVRIYEILKCHVVVTQPRKTLQQILKGIKSVEN